MYWPISAPRIYSASNSPPAPATQVLETDDDAESRENTEGSGSLLEAPSISGDDDRQHCDGQLSLSGASTPMTPMTPKTPGIRPVEQNENQWRGSTGGLGQGGAGSRQVDKEPLLALRMSRTGHLFAVITAAALTIWQTKVGIPECLGKQRSDITSSQLLYWQWWYGRRSP